MGPQELERIAYSVECFLNALRVHDGRARTAVEERLVQWLARDGGKGGYAVYNLGQVRCFTADGKERLALPLPEVKDGRTLYCDERRISLLDTPAWEKGGKLAMLGAAGLIMTMPGTGAAATRAGAGTSSSGGGIEFSNNNNNNNNNNNG